MQGVKKIKRSEIRIGIDSKKWLFIQRQKPETPSPVPLLPFALGILDKDHPRCINSDLALPILCNQKMNEYLKEIADVCGINKTLSVSKMMGYKTLKQTQHYAKILNKKVGEDMEILTQKLPVAQTDNPLRMAQ